MNCIVHNVLILMKTHAFYQGFFKTNFSLTSIISKQNPNAEMVLQTGSGKKVRNRDTGYTY